MKELAKMRPEADRINSAVRDMEDLSREMREAAMRFDRLIDWPDAQSRGSKTIEIVVTDTVRDNAYARMIFKEGDPNYDKILEMIIGTLGEKARETHRSIIERAKELANGQ